MLSKIRAEQDEEGVYFYQAFNSAIADYAVENQRFGGDDFKPIRTTWIKPSFTWVLYRSGYATKPNQERILKVKLSHEAFAAILSACRCPEGGLDETYAPAAVSRSSAGSRGVVQWDPERDLMMFDPKKKNVPRKMLRERSIQIGLQGGLSELYVVSALSIEDVTERAHEVGRAHKCKKEKDCEAAMQTLKQEGILPLERDYVPDLREDHKLRLGLLPGEAADRIARLGMGEAAKIKDVNQDVKIS
ncbi:hypothetical protein TrST_g2375 [Triparma strigata]|uniref:Uncharacterized protein n=1 Tax=Triparma strigata TaxID=1606541 RepID=A0A9W7AJ79_9STRA|nr:hypothetical protein TrST_g2375 [Triparma strigata]